jgi:diacylglycerol O-acyltransferase
VLPEPQPWAPDPEPSNLERVFDAWSGLASDAVDLTRGLAHAIRSPADAVRSVGRTASGILRWGRHLGSTPPLSIEGLIGPDRTWAHSSASIDEVRTIRKAFGGTLNDVVLTAVASGYRELLLTRGEDPDHAVLRTLVPVSVRAESAHGIPDNRVSGFLYELPVDVADPVERLARVHREMDELKASPMAEAGEVVTTLGNLAPPMLVGTASRLGVRLMHQLPQRSVNTVATNVPGPQLPLYCLGREMLAYLPFVPVSFGVRVGTAILSYNGSLYFGVTGDFDTAPDVDVLADAIAEGVSELYRRATET